MMLGVMLQGKHCFFHRILRIVGVALIPLVLSAIGGFFSSAAHADDWPQWLGPKRDGVWRETGIVEKFPKEGPKVRWRTSIGAGYAGPAVVDGRVYITDRILAEGAQNPKNPFGRSLVDGKERILCLEEKTGKVLWQHEYACQYQVSYAAGPRATAAVDSGKVYALGTMGDLYCLDAATGNVLWSKNLPKEFDAPVVMWGFASHPLIDGNRLICLVGGKAGLVMAFDKENGKEIWRALSTEHIGYGPPMIYEVGKTRQLVIWHPAGVNGLDPESGKVYWSLPWRIHSSSMSISTPRYVDGTLFLTSFYNGSMMLKLEQDKPAASVLWKGKWWGGGQGAEQSNRTDGLHSIISTPFVKDGYIYGVCSYGQLRGLKAETGERLWETFEATSGKEARWGNAFLVPQGDRFFLFNERGEVIIARLTPKGYEEISRAKILDPTNTMAGRPVIWSHPAFANKCMYARNDKEILCVLLAKDENSTN